MRYCPMSLTMSWLVWVRATAADLSPSSCPCPFSAAPLVSALAPFCTQPLLDCIPSSAAAGALLRVFLRGGSKPSSLPVNSSLVEARIISDYPLFTFIFKPDVVGGRDRCAPGATPSGYLARGRSETTTTTTTERQWATGRARYVTSRRRPVDSSHSAVKDCYRSLAASKPSVIARREDVGRRGRYVATAGQPRCIRIPGSIFGPLGIELARLDSAHVPTTEISWTFHREQLVWLTSEWRPAHMRARSVFDSLCFGTSLADDGVVRSWPKFRGRRMCTRRRHRVDVIRSSVSRLARRRWPSWSDKIPQRDRAN